MKVYVNASIDEDFTIVNILDRVETLLTNYVILDAVKDYDSYSGDTLKDHVIGVLYENMDEFEQNLDFGYIVRDVINRVNSKDIDVNQYV